MSFIDVALLAVLALAGGLVSGNLGFASVVGSFVFFSGVAAGVLVASGLLTARPKVHAVALAPLLVWPGFFETGARLPLGIPGALGLAGLAVAMTLVNLEQGWVRGIALGLVSALLALVVWWVLKFPLGTRSQLLWISHPGPVGIVIVAASVLVLARGRAAPALVNPRGLALAAVSLTGFFLAYRFLSSAYPTGMGSAGDWLALAAVVLVPLFLGVLAGRPRPEYLFLGLIWACPLGPLGVALFGASALGLLSLEAGERPYRAAGFALAAPASLFTGALTWAKEGVFGFVPPGLALGLGLLFLCVGLARDLRARAASTLVILAGFGVFAWLNRSPGLVVLAGAGALIGVPVMWFQRKYLWWVLVFFSVLMAAWAVANPWSFRQRPRGLITVMKGRGAFARGDAPGALEALTRVQLSPKDFVMAGAAAQACGQNPVPIYEKGLERFPGDQGLYVSFLRYLWRGGSGPKMILWSKKAVLAGVMSPPVFRAMGKGLMMADRFTDAAQAFFTEFLLGDPDGLVYLADIYQRKALFQEAMARGADLALVYRDLVNIHLRRKDPQRALFYIDALLASYPDDTELLDLKRRIGSPGLKAEP